MILIIFNNGFLFLKEVLVPHTVLFTAIKKLCLISSISNVVLLIVEKKFIRKSFKVNMKKLCGSSTRRVKGEEVALHLCNVTEMSIFPLRCKFNCNAIAQPCVGEVARHDV